MGLTFWPRSKCQAHEKWGRFLLTALLLNHNWAINIEILDISLQKTPKKRGHFWRVAMEMHERVAWSFTCPAGKMRDSSAKNIKLQVIRLIFKKITINIRIYINNANIFHSYFINIRFYFVINSLKRWKNGFNSRAVTQHTGIYNMIIFLLSFINLLYFRCFT